MIALHLFRIATLRLGLAVSVVFFSSVGAFFFVLTVFFQAGLRYSPFAAGLMFLPFAVGFAASSVVSGPIANRVGPRIINIGSIMMAISLIGIILIIRRAPFCLDSAGIDSRLFFPTFLLYGLGQGLTQPSLINTVIGRAGVTGEDAGSAVGLFLTTAQAVIALGIAVIGDVFFACLGNTPSVSAYMTATATALSCSLVLQVGTFVLAFTLPRRSVR